MADTYTQIYIQIISKKNIWHFCQLLKSNLKMNICLNGFPIKSLGDEGYLLIC